MKNLTCLSDDELVEHISSLLTSESQVLARLLRSLIEVEERRLDLRAACSSMFDYCTRRLGMSEGQAFRRITAARLAAKFPLVLSLVESRAVHLSALILLREYLTEENHKELLQQASGKSKLELQALIAARFPRPDVPSTIRKLPDRRQAELPSEGTPRPPARSSFAPGRVEPLSEARYKVEFTADQALRDKLERAKNLLSHANPTRDLAVVVDRALDELLDKLEKTKLGKAKRPREPRPSKNGEITRAARRAAFERAGEQCMYVDEHGRRCQERAFLELDHIKSRAAGGRGDADNLRVYCKRHNRLVAEQAFGKDFVENRIHLRRRKSGMRGKLETALTKMGFRKTDALRAVDAVLGELGPSPAKLESLLRAALAQLTPPAKPTLTARDSARPAYRSRATSWRLRKKQRSRTGAGGSPYIRSTQQRKPISASAPVLREAELEPLHESGASPEDL